tara:strand:- start:2598 stop:3542 length:945 start_codon:yes stop_codon:yes gene_type:complete
MATMETLQQLQYPEWVSDRQQQMLNTLFGTTAGGGVMGQALQIPGQQVAGFTPTQTGAMNLASQGIGTYQPYLDAAQAAQTAAMGTAGAGTQALAGMQFAPTGEAIKQYMDPYQQQVTQEALREMDRQGAMAQNQLGAQAVGAGAFGGSRFGVQQAEQTRNLQDIKSRRIFEDMSRNYQQATAAMQAANAARVQQAQGFANLGNVASGIGQRTGALGQAQQAAQAQDVQQQLGIGGMQQQLQQQGFNVGYQNQLNAMMEPYRRLSYGQQMIQGLAPLGGTTTQTVAPMPTTNPYLQAAGGIGTLATGLGRLIGN